MYDVLMLIEINLNYICLSLLLCASMHVNVDTNVSYSISALQTHNVESTGHDKEGTLTK